MKCEIWERFRRHYLPLQRPDEVKLDADDATRLCRLVVDYGLHTQYVADRYDINQRRVQQLAKDYRDTGEIPTIETLGLKPYAEYPPISLSESSNCTNSTKRVRQR